LVYGIMVYTLKLAPEINAFIQKALIKLMGRKEA
jgi:hypothetical protein